MSLYTYPGQAFTHDLKPLKGWYSETGIDCAGNLDSNVNIGSASLPAQKGQVVHAAGVQSVVEAYGGLTSGPQLYLFEMGAATLGSGNYLNNIPLWLWTPPTDPDVYNPGNIAGQPVYGTTAVPADYASVLPPLSANNNGNGGGNLVALVGSATLEIETTEFDTTQTYYTGQPLRAVTSNTDANAGRVTNQRNSGTGAPGFTTSGVVQHIYNIPGTPANWDTIVGYVSRGSYTNSNRRAVVALYTAFLMGAR